MPWVDARGARRVRGEHGWGGGKQACLVPCSPQARCIQRAPARTLRCTCTRYVPCPAPALPSCTTLATRSYLAGTGAPPLPAAARRAARSKCVSGGSSGAGQGCRGARGAALAGRTAAAGGAVRCGGAGGRCSVLRTAQHSTAQSHLTLGHGHHCRQVQVFDGEVDDGGVLFHEELRHNTCGVEGCAGQGCFEERMLSLLNGGWRTSKAHPNRRGWDSARRGKARPRWYCTHLVFDEAAHVQDEEARQAGDAEAAPPRAHVLAHRLPVKLAQYVEDGHLAGRRGAGQGRLEHKGGAVHCLALSTQYRWAGQAQPAGSSSGRHKGRGDRCLLSRT